MELSGINLCTFKVSRSLFFSLLAHVGRISEVELFRFSRKSLVTPFRSKKFIKSFDMNSQLFCHSFLQNKFNSTHQTKDEKNAQFRQIHKVEFRKLLISDFCLLFFGWLGNLSFINCSWFVQNLLFRLDFDDRLTNDRNLLSCFRQKPDGFFVAEENKFIYTHTRRWEIFMQVTHSGYRIWQSWWIGG